ncbi:MAG: tetratricopeptide repeat protein [Cyclobacteriaceae bacterium]|nr:tetratricopeptide repeat protein [Cyclobacteriaceae bacterium]
MKKLFLLVFLLCQLHVKGQILYNNGQIQYLNIFIETDNFGAEYLDVMEQSLDKIPIDTLWFRIINDLAYHYHTRNLQKSLRIINQGLEKARAVNNKHWEGRMQVSQGAILLRMEELNHAERVLLSALEKIPEKETWLLLTNLGYVYERRGDLSTAFEYATKTLDLGEKYGDQKAIAMAYSDMSNLFWKQGRFEKGVEYGLRSIELFEKRGLFDLDFDFTLHVLGNNLVELQRYDEALTCFQRSAMIGEKYGFYNNLSDTYIALTELYIQMGDIENAKNSGKKALTYAELLENDFMIESQNRVQSMGMIHQNLYQGENMAAIEMKQYFLNLGTYIIDSFDVSARISFHCNMESLELDVDRAIPIGLIVNELITNSLKYAFPYQRMGIITITLSENDAHLHLKVSDNGIGIDKGAGVRGSGFGTQLIHLLTKQLDGKMTLTINGGTEVFFEFQITKAA